MLLIIGLIKYAFCHFLNLIAFSVFKHFSGTRIEICRELKFCVLRVRKFFIGIHFLHIEAIDRQGGSCALAESHGVEMDVVFFASYQHAGDKIQSEAHKPRVRVRVGCSGLSSHLCADAIPAAKTCRRAAVYNI